MVTYDDYLQTCYDLSGDSSGTNQTFVARLGNVAYRRAMRFFGRQFEERTKTSTTVTSQQYYQLPIDYTFLKSVKVSVGTYVYPLEEVKSQQRWDELNRMTNLTNTIPTHFFIRLNLGVGGDEVGIWPTPSSTGNVITLVYEASPKTLGISAYTTGTVSITQGTATLTGVGTGFTAQMVGRYLNVTGAQTDGQYYKVSAYVSGTSLTLQNYYEGGSVNGSTYGLYELFGLPEEAQMLPVYFTMWHYFLVRQNAKQAGVYKGLYEDEFEKAKINESEKSRDGVIKRGGSTNLNVDYPGYFPVNI